MAEKEYRRLARSKPRPGFAALSSRCSLWLGRDHLLNLETTGYSEGYRRFYFRDIQSLSIRQTLDWLYWAVAVGVLALACLAGAAAISEPIARYIFAAVGCAFAIALALNLAAGPTCVCHVRTAVQAELLPALNRVRRAKRILEQVRPLLQEAQGLLTPGEIAVLTGQIKDSSPEAEPVSGTQVEPARPREPTENGDRGGVQVPETTGADATGYTPPEMTGYKSVPQEDGNRTP